MNLGDFFPQADKEDYLNRRLKPGQVVYLFSRFTNPAKEKYLVIAYYGPRPLLFTINSRIHPFIARRPELNKCQVKVRAADYDFLDHDSYIDCSQVIDVFDEDEIRQQLLGELSRIKGQLTQMTRREIIRVVQSARTISAHHKRLIIEALQQPEEADLA